MKSDTSSVGEKIGSVFSGIKNSVLQLATSFYNRLDRIAFANSEKKFAERINDLGIPHLQCSIVKNEDPKWEGYYSSLIFNITPQFKYDASLNSLEKRLYELTGIAFSDAKSIDPSKIYDANRPGGFSAHRPYLVKKPVGYFVERLDGAKTPALVNDKAANLAMLDNIEATLGKHRDEIGTIIAEELKLDKGRKYERQVKPQTNFRRDKGGDDKAKPTAAKGEAPSPQHRQLPLQEYPDYEPRHRNPMQEPFVLREYPKYPHATHAEDVRARALKANAEPSITKWKWKYQDDKFTPE